MPSKLRLVLPLCLAFVFPSISHAETESGMRSKGEPSSVGAMPSRGMTMDQVKQRFGQPLKRFDAVGQPPITRWQYDGMMIYFDHQFVIHAVATNGK